ncbi:MAG: phenylacetic acid degradation operon negative regulatory protein PaaX [Proteobacteria bacterium]|nr:phenylacetic acid degradation operon negative regulatory protein PaaX [Pseudomonadota bacterium]
MPHSAALAPILGHLRAEPSRTWSIIVTLYGDAVVPRGGSLWLGTLLEIFEASGIGGNVVRTAMSRLASDGWLERTRVGRNAFYRLAEKGRDTFAAAERRIYAAGPPAWDGAFALAVLDGPKRDADRAALEAAGFATLASGVLVAPPGAAAPDSGAIRLRAVAEGDGARRLAAQAWPPDRLAEGYRRFLAAFMPLRDAAAGLTDLDALVARLLLIHEYRRLVLRDPNLPDALRPEDWPGREARALCAAAYPALLAASERWLDAHALNEDGKLPPPDGTIGARFQA